MLADIWSSILKIEKGLISKDQGFFELGGHSLKATLLINRISKEVGVEIPLKEFFLKDTIEKLAEFIENERWLREGGVLESTEGEELILD